MRNLKLTTGIVILIIFCAGALFIIFRSPKIDTSSNVSSNTTPPTVKTYSLADVALHNNGQSCWTTINGNVYNLTSWISQHPGGAQAILSLCGIDGTNAFNAQHGGQARPEAELKSFLIGTLQ